MNAPRRRFAHIAGALALTACATGCSGEERGAWLYQAYEHPHADARWQAIETKLENLGPGEKIEFALWHMLQDDPVLENRQKAFEAWIAIAKAETQLAPGGIGETSPQTVEDVLLRDMSITMRSRASRAFHEIWGQRGLEYVAQMYVACTVGDRLLRWCYSYTDALREHPRAGAEAIMSTPIDAREDSGSGAAALELMLSLVHSDRTLAHDPKVRAWVEGFRDHAETRRIREFARKKLDEYSKPAWVPPSTP